MKRYSGEVMIEEGAILHLFLGGEMDDVHDHDFIELVYILGGTAEECVNGAAYTVGRGDLLLIREGETHSFRGNGDFSYLNICLDPARLLREGAAPSAGAELLGRMAFDGILRRNGSCLVHFSRGEREEIERILGAMSEEYRARRYGWQAMLRHYLDVFFLSVLRALEERGSLGGAAESVWSALAAYIEDNPTADLSLGTLARRLYYNPSYFSRTFSRHFGLPLGEYVSGRRVALCERLATEREGAITVASLAEASGFSSKAALYRAFLHHRGRTLGSFLAEVKKRTNEVK